MPRSLTGARLAVALGAGFALADGAIVALALPVLLIDLDASVEEVAAVIGVYTATLALALPLAARVRARWLGPAAFVAFGATSAGCAAAGTLEALLVFRALQGVAAGGVLFAAFAPLATSPLASVRLWQIVTLLGLAIGPAIGGALTQALDWRAIFIVQVPVAVLGALGLWATEEEDADWAQETGEEAAPPPERGAGPRSLEAGPAVALGLVSAALSAVVFLLVLVLVSGWSFTPLEAAVTVTVLPAAALATAGVRREPRTQAAVGCLLVAGGVGALGFVVEASAWWTVIPQALAGAGMGLALPALAGSLLPERTAREAAGLLTIRHGAIALALLALAPLVASSLDDALDRAQERGVAVILDAPLGPLDKVELAGVALSGLDTDDPRAELEAALAESAGSFEGEDRAAFDELAERTDETIVRASAEAFRPAFLVSAALALLAALACRPRPLPALLAAAAVAAAGAAHAVASTSAAAPPVRLADPCADRELPSSGGVTGALQDAALAALDRVACDQGATREELVLALADDGRRKAYVREHGEDPRDVGDVLSSLF